MFSPNYFEPLLICDNLMMQPTLIKQKFYYFDTCPFIVCITNKSGDVVFSNSFAKENYAVFSEDLNLNINQILNSLAPDSIENLQSKILQVLEFNANIEDGFQILYNENPIKISFKMQHLEDDFFIVFFKYLPFSSEDLIGHISSTLVNIATDAIICYLTDGKIVAWNAAAEKMFGLKKVDVMGKNISELSIGFNFIEKQDIDLEALMLRNSPKITTKKELTINGENQFFEVTTKGIYANDIEIIGITKSYSNITPYVTSSQLLHKHVENLQYLNDIWSSLSQNLDVQNILQIVTDVTTKFSGAAYGAFFYNSFSADGEAMRLFTLSGAKREDFMKFGMPRNTDIFKKSFTSREIFIANDVTKHADFGHNAPHNGLPKGHLAVKSYMSIPVISMNGDNLGSLLFGHPEPNKFSQEHSKMMQSIASQAAIALENSKLLENVKTLSSKKDVFITMAGHELRSPLTIIKGFIQILDEVNQDNELDIYIEKVLEQVEKLNLLVDDLLDIGQIEAGEIILNPTLFNLSDLITETIETITYAQNTHKISFDNQSDNIIFADRRRIQQVLNNLISNGIKYSQTKDEIIVQSKIENNEAIVKIIDFGIGISDKHQPNIFDRFYRVPSDQNISGIGIGLYLCNKIIKKHKGTIVVNSEIDRGSEFIFRIPANM